MLLGLLVGLQACYTLYTLLLWPYISVVLNCVELASSCLELGYLCTTIAVYTHMRGNIQLKDQHVKVGSSGWPLALLCLSGCQVDARACASTGPSLSQLGGFDFQSWLAGS
jgi:hypothetical protein